MPTLLVTHAGVPRSVPLAASTLVGRAWSCLARVDGPLIPLHWLEIRWSGLAWSWRALAAEERTRGPGSPLNDGWRELPVSTPRKPWRVRLDEVVSVELAEGGPPECFLFDPGTRDVLRGPSLAEALEVRGGQAYAPDREGLPASALVDGELVVLEGRAWRFHSAGVVVPTERSLVDLARPLQVFVDLAALSATLVQGEGSVEIRGEHVRTLAVYLRQRQGDPDGGWLDPTEAWRTWRRLGGNEESPQERVAWDRARLRSHLAAAGVASVDRLFELRRSREGVHVRLGVRTPA